MSAERKINETIADALLSLAGYDRQVFDSAAAAATEKGGRRISLGKMRAHILAHTNPALVATLEAADDFARAVGYEEGALNLPHLQRVYNLALNCQSLPRQVFNEAAEALNGGAVPCLITVLDSAIRVQEHRLGCH